MEAKQISSHPLILIGTDALLQLNTIIQHRKGERMVVVCDANTKQACLPILIDQVPSLDDASVFEMFLGEENKSIEEVERLCKFLMEAGVGRNSLIINLGGGIVGDLGGFAASVFMRGIDFIQIPTTVLAMVDASVGGKTGVNFGGLKNMLGTFSQPFAVLIHPQFIETLPHDERVSGFAEMIKHALLSDENAWRKIADFDINQTHNWTEIIEHSIRFKYQITQTDFQEKGIREQLNFGHTFAHAFEALALKRGEKLVHGFAVASGILAELILANELHILSNYSLIEDYWKLLKKHFIPFLFQENEMEQLLQFMHSDKKNKQGNFTFSLISAPGEIALNQVASEHIIRQVFMNYLHYGRRA